MDQEQGPELDERDARQVDRRARLENVWLRRPWITMLVGLALTLFLLMPARNVRFDYNLLHMQSRGLASVIFQDKLIDYSNRSVLFGVVVADSLDHATNLIAALTNLPTVGSVESMAPLLAVNQSAKLNLVREIKTMMADLQFAPVDMEPVEVKNLYRALWSLHGYCGLAVNATRKDEPEIAAQLQSIRNAVKGLLDQLRMSDPEFASRQLAIFQQALFNDVHETFGAIRNQDASGPLTVNDLPEQLRARFVGVSGKHLIQVYPKKNIWNRAEQEEFIRGVRQVYPTVTGTPVQLYHYTELLKTSFQEAGMYSIAAIAFMVFIHFRKISCVVLALIPVALGFLWLLGYMGLANVPFNPANIMTLPLIVGIGVTNGIHILNRFAEELHPSILAKSTGKAVLVSGLTTIAGFGSLIIAEHRGIRSLGIIMSVGVLTCMIVGLTFLPALLNVLSARGWSIKKKTQRDNAQSTLGREEPR
jgi:predicted RND superfamily exporter protein